MQIKTTMRYHPTLVRMAIIKILQKINAGECVEKREHFYTVGGNVNWYSHYGKQYGDSLRNNIELPYDNNPSPSHIIWRNSFLLPVALMMSIEGAGETLQKEGISLPGSQGSLPGPAGQVSGLVFTAQQCHFSRVMCMHGVALSSILLLLALQSC